VALETTDPGEAVVTVVRLIDQRPPRCGPVSVVAVDGPSGSGKSTLAAALAEELRAPVVRMDHIYPGWDGLAQAVPLVTTEVLEPLRQGQPGAYRRWDWMRSRWGRTVEVPVTPRLVLEGVGCCVRPAGDFATVCVWVEAVRHVRFARGIARDGEAYRPHWERWAAQEDVLYAADGTRERADVVLDTSTL
jgi:cytidylate kinase